MHLWHPTVAYFAAAFFLAAVVAEGISLFTEKRIWAVIARYHLIVAAVMSFFAVLTGIIDYRYVLFNEMSYQIIKSHATIGVFVFIVVVFMANYRFLMEKMLPDKLKMAYLVIGGLGLGLLFGASYLGRTAVYEYGTGVKASMFNFQQTEKYLKLLYGLEKLDPPTPVDSQRAAAVMPLFGQDTVTDTLAASDISHDTSSAVHDTDSNNQILENHQEPPSNETEHH